MYYTIPSFDGMILYHTIPTFNGMILYHTIPSFKGGYLDFSHLTELKKKIHITEIYVKKQYKSSRIKNHKIRKKKIFFYGVPLKRLRRLLSYF